MRAAIMKQRQEEDKYARDYEELRFVVFFSTQLLLKYLLFHFADEEYLGNFVWCIFLPVVTDEVIMIEV